MRMRIIIIMIMIENETEVEGVVRSMTTAIANLIERDL